VSSALVYCNKCQGPLHCETCAPSRRLQDAEAKCVELHGAHGSLKEQLKKVRAELVRAHNSEALVVNQRAMLVTALRNIMSVASSDEMYEIAHDVLDALAHEQKEAQG
jgi:uncharacterized protein YyaL (SSP411 family)